MAEYFVRVLCTNIDIKPYHTVDARPILERGITPTRHRLQALSYGVQSNTTRDIRPKEVNCRFTAYVPRTG